MSAKRTDALALIARAVEVREGTASGCAYSDVAAETWAADILAVAAGAGEALAESLESYGQSLAALIRSAPTREGAPPLGEAIVREKENGAAGQD